MRRMSATACSLNVTSNLLIYGVYAFEKSWFIVLRFGARTGSCSHLISQSRMIKQVTERVGKRIGVIRRDRQAFNTMARDVRNGGWKARVHDGAPCGHRLNLDYAESFSLTNRWHHKQA